MIVYRIAKEEYSTALKASGYAARWNYKGSFVIYTAESRSLACLENLVHRSGEGNNELYRVMIIQVPDNLKVHSIEEVNLKPKWQNFENYSYCQDIGSDWLSEGKTAILKVPSVLIKNEFNFIVNTNHPDFKKIKLTGTEDFIFDQRLNN
jgi:RES domain-containing protein